MPWYDLQDSDQTSRSSVDPAPGFEIKLDPYGLCFSSGVQAPTANEHESWRGSDNSAVQEFQNFHTSNPSDPLISTNTQNPYKWHFGYPHQLQGDMSVAGMLPQQFSGDFLGLPTATWESPVELPALGASREDKYETGRILTVEEFEKLSTQYPSPYPSYLLTTPVAANPQFNPYKDCPYLSYLPTHNVTQPLLLDEHTPPGYISDLIILLYGGPHEIRCDPPDSEQVSAYQKLPRSTDDRYTPRWIRDADAGREGYCGFCDKWLDMKTSAFWYHMHFSHGKSFYSDFSVGHA
jgi:hypothetical protein